ncbi:MAG: RNA polymerase sigma factor RpoD/SigA [Methylovulum sp.]|nr:RNA polymerase sigma factor RpoD/SigA [Methylovulum sp.]
MAYLTEQLSNKKLTVSAANNRVPKNSPKPGNIQFFHYLITEKNNLINCLCCFPITALWLLNECQQDSFINGQDEGSVGKAEASETLAIIRGRYEVLLQTLVDEGINTPAYTENKQALTIALQQFPFSFSDLTQLAGIIGHAYKLRGYKPSPDHTDVITKRLQGLTHHAAKASKLAAFFETLQLRGIDKQCHFLSGAEMKSLFADMVVAEQLWLKARQQLASANSKLVLFIANQYKGGFLDFDDLVQEGQTGLLKAVDRFDYRLGFQFSTYAGYWIRQAISRALSRCERVVRVPCGQVATVNKVYRAKEELIAKTGKEPSVKDLANYTQLSDSEINTILSISQSAISLEISDDEESVFAPIDFLEQQVFTHPFKMIAASNLEELLVKAIEALSPREAKVICSHFGVDSDKEMTLQEIGAELNLTRERVRQIQAIALNKIKLNYGQELSYFL